MKPELFTELRKVRNEPAHCRQVDTAALAKRFEALGISVSASELSSLIPSILDAFSGRSGAFIVPQFIVQTVVALLDGQT